MVFFLGFERVIKHKDKVTMVMCFTVGSKAQSAKTSTCGLLNTCIPPLPAQNSVMGWLPCSFSEALGMQCVARTFASLQAI